MDFVIFDLMLGGLLLPLLVVSFFSFRIYYREKKKIPSNKQKELKKVILVYLGLITFGSYVIAVSIMMLTGLDFKDVNAWPPIILALALATIIPIAQEFVQRINALSKENINTNNLLVYDKETIEALDKKITILLNELQDMKKEKEQEAVIETRWFKIIFKQRKES
ncbi:hypothetical protein M3202_21515 [Alkalihalobacillus oceani]|uniref:Uncharacterized protein n=1 Tax=Halalkalibacter oceani TaxID=1653776 RepID=A0A9X2DTC9_9BACI|nr:hypothetical protein [Halalkalibacter oceani]MCM3716624.1 hypothetical protein [Halalkalibacter oceani]